MLNNNENDDGEGWTHSLTDDAVDNDDDAGKLIIRDSFFLFSSVRVLFGHHKIFLWMIWGPELSKTLDGETVVCSSRAQSVVNKTACGGSK